MAGIHNFSFRRFGATLLVGLLATVAALAIGAGSSSATVYSGSAADPAGDGPVSSRDISAAQTSYDSETGEFSVTTTFAAPPGELFTQITGALGRLNDSGECAVVPLAALGTFLPDGDAVWIREDDGPLPPEADGPADRTIEATRVTLTTTTSELADLPVNCSAVLLTDPDDPDLVFDRTESFAVEPPPKKPRLSASIGGARGSVKRGSSHKVKVRVRNSGDAGASRVKVRLSANGPARAKPASRGLKSIGPGRSKTATFSLKVKPRAKGKIKLRAKVTGKGVKASASKSVRVKVKKPKPGPTGRGLAGKLFWNFETYQYDRSADILGLYFANSRFVHWGMPEGGLKNCSKVTAKKDEDGDLQPGCLRYSFDPKTGAVRIGENKGTYRNGTLKLKLEADGWTEAAVGTWYGSAFAKPGARFKLTLKNASFFGLCGITFYCSTSQEFVTLTRDGRFGRTSTSLITSGGGSIPFVAVGSFPPEDRGTYRVLSRGRIRFSYDDGKTKTETLTIQVNKRGKPDAANEGILLDEAWFYKDEDD